MAITKEVNIKVQEQGFDDLNAKVNRLENSLDELEQQNESLRGSLANSGKSVLDNGGAMGLLNEATGGLAMTVKDAVEATDLFTKSTKAQTTFQKIYTAVMGTSTGALKLFRLALIATGIGAVVVALGLLIANFDKVKKAVLNLIPGLSAVGDFFGSLIDAVTDFIGVTSDATRQLDKMVADSEASLKKSEHFLEANGDKYDEYTNRKIKANIDYNKKVKELAEDEELTEAEKFARLKDFRDKANREILKADQDRADAQAKMRQEEQDKIDQENQKLREKAEAEAKAKQQRDFEVAMAGAEAGREFEKEQRELFEENKKLEEEEAEEALNKSIDDKVKAVQDELLLEQTLADEKKAINEALEASKQDLIDKTFNIAQQLFKKGSAIAKGVAVAQATMNTYQGITSALSATSVIPDPVGSALKFANAALIGVQGFLNVKKILNTKADGSGGGGGGSAPSISAPSAPSFNLVQGTGSNQIAQSLGSQNQPLQAYVVGSAVTSQQELDRNAVNTASL